MEALPSSKRSVHTRATHGNITEDDILHCFNFVQLLPKLKGPFDRIGDWVYDDKTDLKVKELEDVNFIHLNEDCICLQATWCKVTKSLAP
jgi:hypothetical protein